jgi:hypothetical protein
MIDRNTATPYGAACSYLNGLSEGERYVTNYYGEQLLENGNKAFARGDFDALVALPSIITEEGGAAKTIDLIRQQNVNSGVAISANLPLGGTRMDVAKQNISEIVEYGVYSDLPLSFYIAGYNPGTPIGRITRDLYGAGLQHLVTSQGEAMRNIPMVRCDADPIDIPSDYLPQLLDGWQQDDRPNKCMYPVVQHDRLDEEKFPNINRLLDWYDLYLKLGKSFMSAHFAVDVLGYAASGGQSPDCAVSEIGDILDNMATTEGLPTLYLHQLGGVAITVSCRRIAKRSATEGYPIYDALYMSSDDHPTHRNELPDQDISDLEYRRQGGWRVYNTVQLYGDQEYQSAVRTGTSPEQARALATRQMRMFGELALQEFGDPPAIQRVLNGAVESWSRSGPPAGMSGRRSAMLKVRNLTPDKSAGGSGLLYD